MKNKITITNLLLIIAIIISSINFIFPSLWLGNFWMNNYFLEQNNYIIYFLQFFTSQFLHWGIFHIFFNIIFVYYFWNMVEIFLWRIKFIYFFIFTAIFVWIMISIFSDSNTIWMSSFWMAVLAYYTLELKSRKNPEYEWWITALILNILIWFFPWISLVWHLFWAIAWLIFYFLNSDFFAREKIWKMKNNLKVNENSFLMPENIEK